MFLSLGKLISMQLPKLSQQSSPQQINWQQQCSSRTKNVNYVSVVQHMSSSVRTTLKNNELYSFWKSALMDVPELEKCRVEHEKHPIVFCDILESRISASKVTRTWTPRPAFTELDDKGNVEEQPKKKLLTTFTERFHHRNVLFYEKPMYESVERVRGAYSRTSGFLILSKGSKKRNLRSVTVLCSI